MFYHARRALGFVFIVGLRDFVSRVEKDRFFSTPKAMSTKNSDFLNEAGRAKPIVSVNELLSLLRRVRALRFDAHSDAATGWQGTGSGIVVVSAPADGIVVFEESGSWQPSASGRGPIGFKNAFRWSAVGEALRLEHLRFGRENPVLLFDMGPVAGGEWREISPHLCREDAYTASLIVTEEEILVAWSVIGPRKRESIRYTYSFADYFP
jgi:hypothetical protein